jgi:AcrR family transcriptional regulator
MAPPRKHNSDRILDAARTLALTDGPRAVSVAAIAGASGAPAGTLYHRFGNRDGILRAAWLRALERFQTAYLQAARDPDPLEAGVAMAVSVVAFARARREDAQLLLTLRARDLLDAGPDTDFRERQTAINARLDSELRRVTRALHGRADARALDAVLRATVDLPYGVVRRHTQTPTMPRWLEADVAKAARQLLTVPQHQPRHRPPRPRSAKQAARSTASRSDRDQTT